MSKEKNFSFWCPLEIAKSKDPVTGEEVMRLGGIASTSDKDADGEFLDPQGFDINPLLKSGMVNWHHQAKGQPAAIIGEPTKAEIRPEGLYIETDLYSSSPIARDVWELAKTLEHDSKTRRLGYSIEGKVVKRKSDDPSDPGYKHIDKAIITGVAITHMPKNPKTFANIIKGDIDDEDYDEDYDDEVENDEEEKAVDTENAAALKRESLLGAPKILTKGEVIDRIFKDIAGISIEKSEQFYSLIKNIVMAKNKKEVTEEDILKAYDALGLSVENEEDIRKGEDPEDDDEPEKEESEEDEPKNDDAEKESEESEDEPKDEPEEDVRKAESDDDLETIQKAITSANNEQKTFIKAVGVMVKNSTQQIEKAMMALEDANHRIGELEDLVKSQNDTINSMSEALESFGAAPIVKAAVNSRPVDRGFEKGFNNDFEDREPENNSKRVSMRLQKSAVAEILDQAAFANGSYDEEFSKACMTFEASGVLPENVIKRIKNEYGFEIVK